jgi:hypothetical protein
MGVDSVVVDVPETVENPALPSKSSNLAATESTRASSNER